MTSLDSSAVGLSKSGNGETGISALTFFAGLTGSGANTRERDRFMATEDLDPPVAD